MQLSCPEISGDTSRIQDEINEITSQITSITADINILSGDVGDLSSALSGLDSKYWQQGGGASACYGSGIGDMGKDEVISLTDKKLVGIW